MTTEQEQNNVTISVDRDDLTGGIQLSIGDRHGGWRLAGPKYVGQSTPMMTYQLDETDAHEIRRYLDRVFPGGGRA